MSAVRAVLLNTTPFIASPLLPRSSATWTAVWWAFLASASFLSTKAALFCEKRIMMHWSAGDTETMHVIKRREGGPSAEVKF